MSEREGETSRGAAADDDSKTKRTVFELRPIALAFHAEWMPEGSVWYRHGVLLTSGPDPAEGGRKPATSVEMPNGRTPPLCV